MSKIVRVYEPKLLGQLSDEDMMAVRLPVRDWQAIVRELFEDADAQGHGPHVSALGERRLDEEESEAFKAAVNEDAKLACHSNAHATMRVADGIDEQLRQHGWTDN